MKREYSVKYNPLRDKQRTETDWFAVNNMNKIFETISVWERFRYVKKVRLLKKQLRGNIWYAQQYQPYNYEENFIFFFDHASIISLLYTTAPFHNTTLRDIFKPWVTGLNGINTNLSPCVCLLFSYVITDQYTQVFRSHITTRWCGPVKATFLTCSSTSGVIVYGIPYIHTINRRWQNTYLAWSYIPAIWININWTLHCHILNS